MDADKAVMKQMQDSGVLRGRVETDRFGKTERTVEQAKLKFKKDGGTINPFMCGGKMKHRMLGGVIPGKVVRGATLVNRATGGDMPESEVTMVGEEGPELIFNRKDGTQFVTPADVTAQIVDGLEMDDSHEGKEAMAAAKKRIKTKVRHKLFEQCGWNQSANDKCQQA
jgi:hypothetical protein